MSNPLLRTFVEKVTEKSFEKGLFWGIGAGVFVTHFYKEDRYRKLESNYYAVKRRLNILQIEKSN